MRARAASVVSDAVDMYSVGASSSCRVVCGSDVKRVTPVICLVSFGGTSPVCLAKRGGSTVDIAWPIWRDVVERWGEIERKVSSGAAMGEAARVLWRILWRADWSDFTSARLDTIVVRVIKYEGDKYMDFRRFVGGACQAAQLTADGVTWCG